MFAQILRGGLTLAVLLFLSTGSKAQIKELACPSGSSSVQSMNTTDPANGQVRENFCVDRNGVMTTNTGVSGSSGAFPGNSISPVTSGAKLDVILCRDTNVHITNLSTTVQCDTANFSSLDVGKVDFVTCCGIRGGALHPASVLQKPQGTIISITDATHYVSSIAATATSSALGNALYYGTNDNTAWDATWTAATGTAGLCKPITFSGWTFISSAKFLSTVCNTGITGPGSEGSSITGLGYKSSTFVVLPNTPGAGCIGVNGSGNNNCFGPDVGFQFANFGISGGEYANQTNFNGKVFLTVGIDSYINNILFSGLASAAGSTMTGIQFEATGQTAITLIADGFGGGTGGSPSIRVTGGNYNNFVQSFAGNVNAQALICSGGAGTILGTSQSFFGQVIAANDAVDITSGCRYISKNDIIFTTSGAAAIGVDATSSADFDSTLISNPTNVGFFFTGGAGRMSARNTTFTGSSVANDLFASGTTFVFNDMGENKYTNSSATATNCASGASPAVCGNYGYGSVAIAAGATTLTVNTKTISANSIIILEEDDTLGTKLGVTCNTTSLGATKISTRTAGTSFVITTAVAPAVNPACLNYRVVN